MGAVINFAGGLGGHSFGVPNRNCDTAASSRLPKASTRVPTLWIYAANDSFFSGELSRRMADAFRAAGGIAEYHLLPPIGEDGHFLIFSPDAVPIWGPPVARFLRIKPSGALGAR